MGAKKLYLEDSEPIGGESGSDSRFRLFIAEFSENKVALAGFVVLFLCCLVALFAPWFSPQNPYDLLEIDFLDGVLPPGSKSDEITYYLGTDNQGRDMLSAIFYGMRISLGVGIVSALIAAVIGSTIGLLAAFYGNRIESFFMRIVDLQLSIPAILIALILLAFLGRSIFNIMLALVLVEWAHFARSARGAALVEREQEYIEAARNLALPQTRIMFYHLLPNCLPPLLVIGTVMVARAIALESTLSFLGVGVPITEPSLGLLISNGFEFMLSGKYWISFYPGIALIIIIFAINLVGDQLRDVLNPRLKR
jgi:peptide/nickel transport system permease protein